MVGSSGLGKTLSNQVCCWQSTLKLSNITETHRAHASRLSYFLKVKVQKHPLMNNFGKYKINQGFFCTWSFLCLTKYYILTVFKLYLFVIFTHAMCRSPRYLDFVYIEINPPLVENTGPGNISRGSCKS